MIAVKICGLNSEEAVRATIAAGADYTGFVHFPKSPRHASPERAAELKTLLPTSIRSVSVTVNPDDALISKIQSDYLQLHGDETPDRLRAIKSAFPQMKIIKAIAIRNGDDIAIASRYYDCADMLMFDAKAPSSSPPLAGGQGGNPSTDTKGHFGDLPTTTRNRSVMIHTKAMRKKMTNAEWMLWKHLSRKQLEGYKFRRQQSIGHYIVDFICMEKRLIIELDGGQHAEDSLAYDTKRTEFLENAGYAVLRFWNNEVLEQTEGVVDRIVQSLRRDSPPVPPASGGDERGWLPGGNGLSFNWTLLKGHEFPLPWFLSGGLNADNVAQAIRQTGAAMVDVSSGIERAPGVKDAALIEAFVKAARI